MAIAQIIVAARIPQNDELLLVAWLVDWSLTSLFSTTTAIIRDDGLLLTKRLNHRCSSTIVKNLINCQADNS